MPTILALGPPSKRTITYTGSVKEGVTLHFDGVEKFISSEFLHAILRTFQGTTLRCGFGMAGSSPDDFGIWVEYYSEQMNPEKLYPRHAAHIAAILVHEGYITCRVQGNTVVLQFKGE